MRDAKSVEFVWEWFNHQQLSLDNLRQQVLDSIIHHHPIVHHDFIYKSMEEVNEIFDDNQSELEVLTSFSLVASMEAIFNDKFNNRSRKTRIGRRWDKISKEIHRNRISLEEHLLSTILKEEPFLSREVNMCRELIKFRHWVAHGRYWEKRDRKIYTPQTSFEIVSTLMDKVEKIKM